MANCASVATPSDHERRANPHYEAARSAAAECERNSNGQADLAASQLPALVISACAAARERGRTRAAARTCFAAGGADRLGGVFLISRLVGARSQGLRGRAPQNRKQKQTVF